MALLDFTDADLMILKQVVNRIRDNRVNTPSRPSAERAWDAGADHQAPETYIAKTPPGGIPALSGSATGTSTIDAIPGSAVGNIYRIQEDVVTGIAEMLEVPNLDKTLYNISTTAVSGSIWITVTRTKFGRWLAQVGGGAVQEKILFRVSTADTVNCTVEGEVLARPCDVTTVPDEVGGEVTIYDGHGCQFDEPDADLIGRVGTAFRGKAKSGAALSCAGVPEGTCIWFVETLCCPGCTLGTGTG